MLAPRAHSVIRLFVVHHDPESCRRFCDAIAPQMDYEIVGTESDPLTAVDRIETLKPDALFLDVDLHGIDGFELFRQLRHRVPAVFSSSREADAVRAFEVRAVDFLLEPIDPDRVKRALTTLTETLQRREKVRNLTAERVGLQKIVCYHGDAYEVVWLKDIVKLEKNERYTTVVTRTGQHFLSDLSLGYLAEHIKDARFLQINRSLIVTHELLARYRFCPRGGVALDLQDGDTCSVSRRRVKAFKAWLDAA